MLPLKLGQAFLLQLGSTTTCTMAPNAFLLVFATVVDSWLPRWLDPPKIEPRCKPHRVRQECLLRVFHSGEGGQALEGVESYLPAYQRRVEPHLCRCVECAHPGFHCSSFAACDAKALVDLGAYAHMSGWWLLVRLGRGCMKKRVPPAMLPNLLWLHPEGVYILLRRRLRNKEY